MSTQQFNKIMSILVAFVLLAIGLLSCGCGERAGETESKPEDAMSEVNETYPEPPSLQAQLDERKAQFAEQAPPQLVRDFETGIAQIRASGILEQALNVGDTAVDFTLPDATGDSVTLSTLLADGPVVLAWYRGGWCPYCNLELAALNDVLPQIEQYGAELVAISPEVPDSAASTVAKGDLEFTVLSDVGNEVAEDYGLVYRLSPTVLKHFEGRIDVSAYNADSENKLPLAVTYVVDSEGVIQYAFIDADYKRRGEPAEILRTLRELNSQASH